MAVKIQTFRAGGETQSDYELAEVSNLREDPDILIWVDVADPTESEIARLTEEFGLDELVAEDIAKGGQRPRIDPESDPLFVNAYGIVIDGEAGPLTKHEISILLAERTFVTIRRSPLFDLSDVEARVRRRHDMYENGAAFLAYVVLDEIVDGYFKVVDALEITVDETENLVFEVEPEWGDASERAIQERIFTIRRKVVSFYEVAIATRELLNSLARRDLGVVPEPMIKYFQDVYDHLLRVVSSLEVFRDLVSGMFEAHLAVVNNQLALQGNMMNKVMKKMTSWGAILLGATLIAGIYGMNFNEMPELRWAFGYPMALGSMGIMTIVLYVVFKRKDWI